MGYRSDIVIAFAFKTKEQIDEVMAVYRINYFVQRHGLAEHWDIHEWDDCWGLTYTAGSVKWYSGYEDVIGLEYMLELVRTFVEQRGEDVGPIDDDGKQEVIVGFPYAYRKLRIGEEDNDTEHEVDSNCNLDDVLYDRIGLVRHFETNF